MTTMNGMTILGKGLTVVLVLAVVLAATSKPSLTNCPNAFAAQSYFQVLVYSILSTSKVLLVENVNSLYQVVIAAGSHLFPFRTEKLSPLAPMVLQCNAGE